MNGKIPLHWETEPKKEEKKKTRTPMSESSRKKLQIAAITIPVLFCLFQKEFIKAAIALIIGALIILTFNKLAQKSKDSVGAVRPDSPVVIASYIFLSAIIIFLVALIIYYFSNQ